VGLMDRLRAVVIPPPRPAYEDSFAALANIYNVGLYPLGLNQTLTGREEGPAPGYTGLVAWAYGSNAVVYAVEQVRVQLFAEASFRWRWRGSGKSFGNSDLDILRRPWPNGTTGDLLTRMLLDADLSGDAFVLRSGNPPVLTRLRPDWVTVITDGNPWAAGSEVVGYAYQPGGPAGGEEPVTYDVSEVAHFAPSPDPLSPKRGMSWLTPVIREISADIGMTEHKRSFLVNGATPNLVISLDPAISKAAYDQWVATFQAGHRGARNAYETMFLGGGAKAEVVGKDLQQLDFKLVQGAGETRIAAAAGVPPVIVGLSEGLQAATYSNYGQARRRFADGTMRPLWRNLCGSLETILLRPGGADLAIDDSNIAFLQDDMKDRADIQSTNASAIGQLVKDGFTPDSAVLSITTNDLTNLVHTGLYSVQLQPPMPEGPPEPEPAEPAEPEPEESDTEEEPPARAWQMLVEAAERRADAAERRADTGSVINVTSPDVNIHPADVNVTIERGAIEAPVSVTTPDVRVINADSVEMDTSEFARAVGGEIAEIMARPIIREVERDEDGRPIRVVERREETTE
jgi:phage portal protein BeeE